MRETRVFKLVILAAGLWGMAVTSAISQTDVSEVADLFEARVHVGMKGDTMSYRLLKPLDYNAVQSYPLVVCLSGGAGRGTDNIRQLAGSKAAQVMSAPENRTRYPAFILAPQCPPGSDWGRTLGEAEREILRKRGRDGQPSVGHLVFEVMTALEKEFNIDTTRRYITGQSMGGAGTWHFVLTRPTLFAAAVVVCGAGNPKQATTVADMPLWIFHGTDDRTVPIEFSRQMIAAIEEAGGDPKYNIFPGVGHNSWHQAFDTPGLLSWLFAQRK